MLAAPDQAGVPLIWVPPVIFESSEFSAAAASAKVTSGF
jgi:hypothetical protein